MSERDAESADEIDQRRYDGDPDEWGYGDPKVGYNVPLPVREGGATRPMEREELSGNGVAYSGHSAPYVCQNCGNVHHLVTPDYQGVNRCRGCGELVTFRLQGWEDAE